MSYDRKRAHSTLGYLSPLSTKDRWSVVTNCPLIRGRPHDIYYILPFGILSVNMNHLFIEHQLKDALLYRLKMLKKVSELLTQTIEDKDY